MQNYVKVFLIDKNIVAYSTLKDMKGNLPEADFIQTHKSYVVAIDKVSVIKENQIEIDEYKIPVSVRMKKIVRARLFL